MMHGSIDMGGSKWERLQYARAANSLPREFRATNAAYGKLELTAMEDLKTLATDSREWEVIPMAHRTVGFRNTQFKLVSNFGCSIAAKHIDIHNNFPFAAFPWMLDPVGLEANFAKVECKHRLGYFLKGWYE